MAEVVAVAMSGGLDSAVAAALLQRQGYAVFGITMTVTNGLCPTAAAQSERDIADAKAVAARLGIPHHTVDLADAFRESVVEPFVRSYFAGETPNPCVDCNRAIKFGALLQVARTLGADRIATGHYARLRQRPDGRVELQKARDPKKDQSYMLWALTQEQLQQVLFPLCDLPKSEVRAMAAALDLPVLEKRESQDICFIPDGDYAAFLLRYTGKETVQEGDFIAPDGTVLGRHRGLIHYTVGQRKGLGIALGKPRYVARKEAAANTVTLAQDEELYAPSLTAREANYLAGEAPAAPLRVEAKIRYHAAPAPATLTPLAGSRFVLSFDAPQRAPAPGQSVAVYDGETLLGGGTIE